MKFSSILTLSALLLTNCATSSTTAFDKVEDCHASIENKCIKNHGALHGNGVIHGDHFYY